ncbi:hypothetical protein HDC37_002371 [Microbacterium sp. AK009]|uniref:hypothetical protein n=1 Tax=Microbacterium sp. AK009 TaxID=2723068 RepID=UPI0015CB6EA0|nr:hypothetical protein [Microbacterium sp. AK009]NYF17526.1 hypothetical protein [Microbacterium sp. AK009]
MPVTRRTRTLLSWLPAALLVLIIGAIVVGTFTVQASWWAEDDPEASADQKASDGGSMLTDAGFDYVNVEGVLRVRVGDGALPASDLGLRANETKAAEFRRPVRALIAAGDEVHVVEDVVAASATAADDRLATLTVAIDGAGSWRGAIDGLQARAAEFGWDAAQFEGLDERLLEFNSTGSGEVFEVEIGPGSDADTAVTAEVAFSREGGATTVALRFAPPE